MRAPLGCTSTRSTLSVPHWTPWPPPDSARPAPLPDPQRSRPRSDPSRSLPSFAVPTYLERAMRAPFPAATLLGYPRIGPRRALKRAVASSRSGRRDADTLRCTARERPARTRTRPAELVLAPDDASSPSDVACYDQVWSVAAQTGAIPPRFDPLRDAAGAVDLAGHFRVARG